MLWRMFQPSGKVHLRFRHSAAVNVVTAPTGPGVVKCPGCGSTNTIQNGEM
jgi:hypothetical protein